MTPEIEALITLAELAPTVRYRGEGCTGGHLFSDCSPMVTHMFETIEEGVEFFAGRIIRDLPEPALSARDESRTRLHQEQQAGPAGKRFW